MTISATTQNALEATQRSEILLVFLDVIDEATPATIRLVCEENKGISFANGAPVNYYLDGNLYTALPFSLARMSDDDRPARAAINVPAFSSEVGSYLRTVAADSLRLRIRLYPESDWSGTVSGVDNSRSPLATPELLYDANHLWIKYATGGGTIVRADIGGYDFSQEPLGKRVTQDLCPDLYR